MILQIDNREPDILKNYFRKNYLNTQLKHLPLGDILIQHNDIEVIIERKTITDLASSIRDGRLREQKIRLIHNYPKRNIIYIIEGDITKENDSMHFNKINKYTVYSSIINMLVRDNIHLFMTTDIYNTIEFIEMLMKKIKKGTLKVVKYTDTQHSNQLNTMVNPSQNETDSTIYEQHISTRHISSVKINKQSNLTQDLVFKSQLACIPRISIHIAQSIMNVYPTMKILIESLHSKTSEARIEIIQNIKTNKSRRIGIHVAKNINKYIFN